MTRRRLTSLLATLAATLLVAVTGCIVTTVVTTPPVNPHQAALAQHHPIRKVVTRPRYTKAARTRPELRKAVINAAGQPTGGLIRVADYGITPNTDYGAPLRALLAGLTSPAVLQFDAGVYTSYPEPILIGNNDVEFRGAGQALTRLQGRGLWAGVPDVQFGSTISAAHRPPVNSVLDASCAGKLGWRSCGDTVLMFAHHPLCWGGLDPVNTAAYDGYGKLTSWTLQMCAGPGTSGIFPSNAVLFALGTWQDPCPIWIGTTPAADPTQVTVTVVYRIAGASNIQGQGTSWFSFTLPANQVFRLRIWYDGQDWGVANNGTTLTTTGQTHAPGGLLQNWGKYPCMINADGMQPPGGQVPGWILYGFKTNAAPLKLEPANDMLRYYDVSAADPTCLIAYSGVQAAGSARLLATDDGPALGGGYRKYGLICTTQGSSSVPGATSGFTLKDLWVDGGAPAIGIGDVLEVELDHVTSWGETDGVASLARNVFYTLTLNHCHLAGYGDAALSLRLGTDVHITATNVDRYGAFGARFCGVDASWVGGMFAFYAGGSTRAGVASLAAGYGSDLDLQRLFFDTESGPFTQAVIYCEQQPYAGTMLGLRSIESIAAPAGPFVWLTGFNAPGVCGPSVIDAIGCKIGGGTFTTGLQVDGPNWSGRFDTTLLPAAPFTGSGAAAVAPH